MNTTIMCLCFSESYYSPPRVLSCLHIFCENCLNKLVNDCSEICEGQKSIRCTICNQVTSVSSDLEFRKLFFYYPDNVIYDY